MNWGGRSGIKERYTRRVQIQTRTRARARVLAAATEDSRGSGLQDARMQILLSMLMMIAALVIANLR